MTPAIFIPGLLCTADLYAPQREALGDRLDITIADHTRHDTMAAIAEDILAAAPERFVLAGLSMGGYVALEVMRRAGGRVQALLLLDTNARADAQEQRERRKSLMALAEREGIDPVAEALMPMLLAKQHLDDEALTGTMRKMAIDTGVEAFLRQQKAIMTRDDARPRLADIDCPTLVIVGEEDILTPPERAREIAAGIPGAKLEVIPGSGHISTLEKPEAVNQAISRFLENAEVI